MVAVPLWVVLLSCARRYRRGELGGAFVIGYATHLLGDSYGALVASRFGAVTFLLWPVLPAPDYEAASFAHHADELASNLARLDGRRLLLGWDDPFVLQLWLAIGVIGLWVAQGMPPLATVRRRLRG